MFELISEGQQGFTKQKGRRKIQAMGKECAKALPPGGQDKLVELTRVLGVWSSEGDRERNLRRRLRSNQRLIMQWFVWTSSKKQCIEETEAKYKSFPCDLDGKESACSVGDPGLIPGLGRSPGGGHGNSLQYSCLENPMYRRAWQAAVHAVAKSWTRLSDTHTHKQWMPVSLF